MLQSQVSGSARAQSASEVPRVGSGTSRQGPGEPGTSRMVARRDERVAEPAAGQLAGGLEDEPAELEDRGNRGRADRTATGSIAVASETASRGCGS